MISIIIPTYNNSNQLLKTIDHVLLYNADDYEIIIIDDASTDDDRSEEEESPDNQEDCEANGGTWYEDRQYCHSE